MRFINASVGIGQRNHFPDVRIVQQLLNMNLGRLNRYRANPLHPVEPNGLFDRHTEKLLRAYCVWIDPHAPAVITAPADSMIMKALDAAIASIARFVHGADSAAPRKAGAFAGDLGATNWILLTLIRGALAWQGVFPPAATDPVLAALDANRIANFRQFKTLCRMRQSRAVVSILLAVAPTLRKSKVGSPEAIAESVALAMALADIITPLRKAAFLAQIAAESDGFQAVREYATGDEYEGRRDLGNVLPGDGRRFAGRGYIQLTGRGNYTRAWQDLGLPTRHNPALKPDVDVPDPAYAETLEGAAKVTAWYWNHNKLNAIADRLSKVGTQEKVLLELSIAINGQNRSTGLPNGWEGRKRYFQAAKHALGIH